MKVKVIMMRDARNVGEGEDHLEYKGQLMLLVSLHEAGTSVLFVLRFVDYCVNLKLG